MLDERNHHQIQVAELQLECDNSNNLEWYGFDPSAPPPDEDIESVEVYDIPNLFSNDQSNRLQTIDILRDSNYYGTDIFEEAKVLLGI